MKTAPGGRHDGMHLSDDPTKSDRRIRRRIHRDVTTIEAMRNQCNRVLTSAESTDRHSIDEVAFHFSEGYNLAGLPDKRKVPSERGTHSQGMVSYGKSKG
jgi:hypothetical protein